MWKLLLLWLPSAFSDDAKDMRRAVNDARGLARYCGATYYWPAKDLEWDARLHAAATCHARDMATRGYFSHRAPPPRPSDPCDRSETFGWTNGRPACVENIAAGERTVLEAMSSLLASPGHCANIMSPDSVKLGVGVATGGTYGVYWAQHFGPPEGPGVNANETNGTTVP